MVLNQFLSLIMKVTFEKMSFRIADMKYFLFFPIFCMATTTTPLELDFNIGYREDHLKWRIAEDSNSVLYQEDYSNMNFMTVEASIGKVYRDLVVQGDFSYSFIGKGDLQQKTVLGDFIYTDSFFFSTKASSYSASGYMGYFVNLTPDRLYTAYFLPHFGYCYSSEKINNRPENNSELTSTLPDSLKLDWRGLFLGIDAGFIPNDLYAFSMGYAFHFLHIDFNTLIQQQWAETSLFQKVSVSDGGNIGHFGFIKISRLWPCYTLSFLAKIRYYTTEVHSFSLEGEKENFASSVTKEMLENQREFKLRQTALMILVSLSRKF